MTERGRLGSSFLQEWPTLSEQAVLRPDDLSFTFLLAIIASYCIMLVRTSAITLPQPWQIKYRLLQTFPCFTKRFPNWISSSFKLSISKFLIAGVKLLNRGDWLTNCILRCHSRLFTPNDLKYNSLSMSRTWLSSFAMIVELYLLWRSDVITISPKLLPADIPPRSGPTKALRCLLPRGIGPESSCGPFVRSFLAWIDAEPLIIIPKLKQ